ALVERSRRTGHLARVSARDTAGAERVVYRFEHSAVGLPKGDVLEAGFATDGRLAEVRATYRSGDKPLRITLSNLTLGEPIPDETFTAKPPEGTSVEEADRVDTFQLISQFVQIVGELAAEPKKPG